MNKIATREAYGKTLVELGEINKDIVVLDADLSKSTKTIEFSKAFPERFFDMGIAEQNLIGTAAGLATAGKIPFASSFAIFAVGRSFEQIRNSVAYPNLNVKIAATHSGISVGEDGGSHQSIEDIAIMRSLPNMTILVPADGMETKKAIKAATEYRGPVYIRLGRLALPVIYDESYNFEIGKINKLRCGKEVTILATGLMVNIALEAAKVLENEGIDVEVLNVSTIKPFDKETVLESVKKTKAVVTAEEHNIIGGLGSAAAEVLAEEYPAPLVRVGIKDTFGESGKPEELLEKYGLNKEEIVKAVHEVMRKKL